MQVLSQTVQLSQCVLAGRNHTANDDDFVSNGGDEGDIGVDDGENIGVEDSLEHDPSLRILSESVNLTRMLQSCSSEKELLYRNPPPGILQAAGGHSDAANVFPVLETQGSNRSCLRPFYSPKGKSSKRQDSTEIPDR